MKKTVWLRLGVSIPDVTKSQYERMKKDQRYANWLIAKAITEGNYKYDGETYIPAGDREGEWGFVDDVEIDIKEGMEYEPICWS